MIYPFTAIVGQSKMKTALLLNAINPAIGGVLVRGEKGTGKSTAARALAALLPPIEVVEGCPWAFAPHEVPNDLWPDGNEQVDGALHLDLSASSRHRRRLLSLPKGDNRLSKGDNQVSKSQQAAPFVSLPIGATEDRLLGTLDIERALQEGKRHFEAGLLAQAHRGVLYVDEVNLLGDHLVDSLLDVAAMGVNRVEREGLSVTHPARFVLVGTMNPEEGDLRPQLLDRFGLTVEVTGPRDPMERIQVVRNRLAWEANSLTFGEKFVEEEQALRAKLVEARTLLPQVYLSDGMLELIARICIEFEVDGLRADIVMAKTACTLAAFHGRSEVLVEDVRQAAELALPHRRRRQPFEQPGLDQQQLDDVIRNEAPPQSPPTLGGKSNPSSNSKREGMRDKSREPETEGDRRRKRRR